MAWLCDCERAISWLVRQISRKIVRRKNMSCRVSPFWFLFFFISIVVPAPFKEVLSSSTTSSVTSTKKNIFERDVRSYSYCIWKNQWPKNATERITTLSNTSMARASPISSLPQLMKRSRLSAIHTVRNSLNSINNIRKSFSCIPRQPENVYRVEFGTVFLHYVLGHLKTFPV